MFPWQSLSQSGGASPAAIPEDLLTTTPGGREASVPLGTGVWGSQSHLEEEANSA